MGRVVSYNEDVPRCTFCGKTEHQVRKLVAGPSAAICDECIELWVDHRLGGTPAQRDCQRPDAAQARRDQRLSRPVRHRAERGETHGLSVAVYNHYKRVNMELHESAGQLDGKKQALGRRRRTDPLADVEVAKSNICCSALPASADGPCAVPRQGYERAVRHHRRHDALPRPGMWEMTWRPCCSGSSRPPTGTSRGLSTASSTSTRSTRSPENPARTRLSPVTSPARACSRRC